MFDYNPDTRKCNVCWNFFVLLFWEADAVDRVFNGLPLNKMVLINVVIFEALKYGVS